MAKLTIKSASKAPSKTFPLTVDVSAEWSIKQVKAAIAAKVTKVFDDILRRGYVYAYGVGLF
jgi:hypothetical protein